MVVIPKYDHSAEESLRVVTQDGEEYNLPYRWALDNEHSVEMRGKTEDRALSHGGVETGDYKAKVKNIELSFYVKANSRSDFDSALDEIKQYFIRSDYKLYAGRDDQYFRVSRLTKFKEKYVPAFKGTFCEVVIGLRCADPFRYADDRENLIILVEELIGEEGLVFEVENEGNVDTPIVVSFKPSGVMTEISLESLARDESFIVQDTMLTPEKTIVVSGENATVYRDNENAINTFNGTFISLNAGKNKFKYRGAPGTIQLSYLPRWW